MHTVHIITARLRLLACGVLALFFLPGALTAAAADEIAILKSADLAIYTQVISGFKAILPGTATIVEYNLQGDLARGRQLAARIRASSARLVLAVGPKAALAAKLEIFDTPVLVCLVLDSVAAGLNAPNLIGISLQIPIEHQLQNLHALLPERKRVGVLYDQAKTAKLVDEARRHTAGLGLELITHTVRDEKEVPTALRTLLPQVDVLWLLPDSTVLTEDSLRFLLGTALDANVPVIGFSAEQVRSGVLAGLYVDYGDVGRQAGELAAALLRGESRPFTSPISPDRVRLALNLKTAKFLNLTIPVNVKDHADTVY